MSVQHEKNYQVDFLIGVKKKKQKSQHCCWVPIKIYVLFSVKRIVRNSAHVGERFDMVS